MLIKLLPEQAAKLWEVVRFSMEESLPPITVKQPQTMNNILTAILCDRMQVWFGVSEIENTRVLDAVITTTLTEEAVSGGLSLLIYTMYAYNHLTAANWREYYNCIYKYARSRDCQSITAFTENEKIIKAATLIPGGMLSTLVTFPVN